MTKLKRTLNLAEVVFFASGVILGAGIYALIGKSAGVSGNMLWLSFAIAAFTALLSLFAYAELCALYPEAGGEYSYVKQITGTKWAYAVGSIVALSGIISTATISLGFAGYFSQLLDVNQAIMAVVIIFILFGVNAMGIRHSSMMNIIFTLVEVGGLIYVIIAAAPSLGKVSFTEAPPGGLHTLLAGAAICFFAFTGFEDSVKLAEETKNPEKNIPRALFISAAIVMVLYICLALLVVSAVPFGELADSDKPLSAVAEARFGRSGAIIIAVVALFSTSNSLLSNMLGSSRVMYTMARDKSKTSLLAKVLPGRKTPFPALALAAIVAVGFSLIGDIERVAMLTNFFVFATFIIINVSVIYLRIRKPKLKRPFRIPFAIGRVPVIPVLAIALLLVMTGYVIYGLVK